MADGKDKSCLVDLRVVPNASKDEIVGWMPDGRLKVKVHAVPEGGRANRAVEEFVAKALSLPKRAVSIEKGGTSRDKTVRVAGLSMDEVRSKII
jgi:uncharacterized protein